MKVNRQNTVTCSLTNAEAAAFEAWGTSMNINTNQAIKRAIAFAIQNLKPKPVVVEPEEVLEVLEF